jgi:hypothetical protein
MEVKNFCDCAVKLKKMPNPNYCNEVEKLMFEYESLMGDLMYLRRNLFVCISITRFYFVSLHVSAIT